MKSELSQHSLAYIVLVLGLLAYVAFSFTVWPDRGMLRIAAVAVGSGYFAWGVWVHRSSKEFSAHILFEYLGAGGLATLLLWLITV